MPTSADFVHLQVHSEYSFQQSPVRIPALLKQVESLGQNAIAITDHGFLFGVLEFYMEKPKAIKRILGCHIYIENEQRATLLAENEQGYKNLIKITSETYTTPEKWQETPIMSLEFLKKHKDGLIAIVGDFGSRLGQDIANGMNARALQFLDSMREIYDKEHLFLSLQNHYVPEEEKINDFFREYAAAQNTQLVVTNNVHYLTKKDAQIHKLLLSLKYKALLADFESKDFPTDEFYLKSAEEMYELFPNDVEALENTVKIAERCNVIIKTNVGSEFWPKFNVPQGYKSEYEYLEKLVKEKISKRYPDGLNNDKIMSRVQIELSTIEKMNVPGYFLIIADFINWAKSENIPMGPGRGSAAGSIIAYILGITELNPLPYDLLFERFLNPERISMPDVDIDISDKDRHKLIDYITKKYGSDNVTQLITYGRYKAKNALWAAGRALDLPRGDVAQFADKIPFKPLNITLKQSLEIVPELEVLVNSNDTYRNYWDLCLQIENLISNSGTHAAAIVIAPCNMSELVPIYRLRPGDVPAIQYDKHYAEEIGLLKMDILGLRNLSIIQDAVQSVNNRTKANININDIPLEDAKTFELFGRGQTVGIFQFESKGMQKYLQELKPSCLEDLIAMNALYRPGPMEQIPRFIKCKNGFEKIDCYHQDLEKVLGETYGVIVYQEQVMRLTQILAGFSLGKADLLRRAMGKKAKKDMDIMEPEFFKNGADRGYSESLLKEIWEDLIPFCGYAFNKSHSATYAYVAYQTAYLKANFPQEYMAAVMTAESMDSLPKNVTECKRIGITVLPPDVNKSREVFCLEGKAIRWGLSQIKGVGEGVARDIEKERKENGKYKSFFDFARRLHLCEKVNINKIALENLAKSGAFDSMPGTRAQKFNATEIALADAVKWKKEKNSSQMSLFGGFTETEPSFDESATWSFLDEMSREMEVLGLQAASHPLDAYYAEVRGFADMNIEEMKRVDRGSTVNVGGVVTRLDEKTAKADANKVFAIITMQDQTGETEIFCGSEEWNNVKKMLSKNMAILAHGRINDRMGRNQIMLSKIYFLDDLLKKAKFFHINIDLETMQKEQINETLNYMNTNKKEKGCELLFYISGNIGYKYMLKSEKFCISPKRENLEFLIQTFGRKNVWISDKSD